MSYNTSELLSPRRMESSGWYGWGRSAALVINRNHYNFIWVAAAPLISCQWTCQSGCCDTYRAPLDSKLNGGGQRLSLHYVELVSDGFLNKSFFFLPLKESVCISVQSIWCVALCVVWQENQQSFFKVAGCLCVLVLQYGNSALLVMHCWSHHTFPSTAETLLCFWLRHTQLRYCM